ncbi:MAG: hypothetical protein KDL87_13885, partial [Verrucomicrobiae bacterium]|nr:hypothetical protein [Verrucomicrobiae bacterium]
TYVLPPSVATFTSLDSSIAAVTADGTVLGLSAGSTTIRIDAFGITAATAVTVGVRGERFLEFFPVSYVLKPGQTRQFLVRERLESEVVELSTAADGTLYFLGDGSTGSITSDGLFAASSPGQTVVTIVQGGFSFDALITVTVPQTGTTTVGSSGAILTNANGAEVGIPNGALSEDTQITVQTFEEADLPYALPNGFNYAGGVVIDGFEGYADQPFSVALPAPVGTVAGEVVAFLQPVTIFHSDGSSEEQWMLVDLMIVGDDGMMRTNSPPNAGLAFRNWNGNQNMGMRPSVLGGVAATGSFGLLGVLGGLGDLTQRQEIAGRRNFGANSEKAPSTPGVAELEDVTFGGGGSGQKVFAGSDMLGDWYMPMVEGFDYRLRLHYPSTVGLVEIEERGVSVVAGTETQIFFAQPPRFLIADSAGIISPTLEQASFEFVEENNTITPQLKIKGSNFLQQNPYPASYLENDPELGNRLEDIYVTFEVGPRDTFDTDGNRVVLGGADYIVTGDQLTLDGDGFLVVPVPIGVNLANAFVTVTRPMLSPLDAVFRRREFVSNPIAVVAVSKYGFVAGGARGEVSVIDISGTETLDANGTDFTITDPKEVARIVLGFGTDYEGQLAPRDIATTP